MSFTIKPYSPADKELLQQHLARHRAESGVGDIHFMPFDPADHVSPRDFATEASTFPLSQPSWQRWFLALDVANAQVIGHVNIKGDGLKTGLHRCELGIGIERLWRARGIGRALMEAAISFARETETLAWIDLRVFAHNAAAQSLYRSLGFIEIGCLRDRFRIGDTGIDDVLMSLAIKASLKNPAHLS